MTTQHTPTPWVIDGHNMASIIRLQFPIGHPDCKHITGTYENIARCEGDNWKANAVFIVRACNAHGELMELLEVALELQEVGVVDFKKYGFKTDACITERFRAVLAKARGEA